MILTVQPICIYSLCSCCWERCARIRQHLVYIKLSSRYSLPVRLRRKPALLFFFHVIDKLLGGTSIPITTKRAIWSQDCLEHGDDAVRSIPDWMCSFTKHGRPDCL